MWKVLGAMPLLLVCVLTQGCSIDHHVGADYGQYLANNAGRSSLPKSDVQATFRLTKRTLSHRYEFRSWMAGYANVWIVECGTILKDTLRSADVQRAFGSLRPASATDDESASVLTFDLTGYSFVDKRAHVAMKVTLSTSGAAVFDKTYFGDGEAQGGKMFWGGPFAMKNATQQSTKLALDKILTALIRDLNQASH